MLLLLCALFAHVPLVSSGRETICYGGSYDVPIYYTPPLFPTTIFYKPRGKEKILAVSEGKSMHKRFLVRTGSIQIRDLTEQDDQAMLFFGQSDTVKLYIKDCQPSENYFYGRRFSWMVPTYTEYVEFSQMTDSGRYLTPIVIWNRTDASSDFSDSRRRVRHYFLEIDSVKKKDSGYYKCLGSSGELIIWKRIKVDEHYVHYNRFVGDTLLFEFPNKFSTVPGISFKSQESGFEDTSEIDIRNMDPRMTVSETYFSVKDLKDEDGGLYEFIDEEGDVGLKFELSVDYPELSGWVYLVALVIIVIFIVCCCCCVKKCCCKKDTNKRSSSASNPPPVIHHDTTQPTQPVVRLEREPRVIRADPPTYYSAVANMNLPPSTQITVPDGRSSTPLISNGSDSEPHFEFKGAVFPSAPPLSSGTDIQDVYTSDKLNFL